jgi:DNA-binding transcriptional ArsR family regulator
MGAAQPEPGILPPVPEAPGAEGEGMSIKAMNWAWQPSLKFGEKLILLALADHADNDGYCWPGTRGIAEKCDMSRPTLHKHLNMLREMKLLCIERRTDSAGRTISNGYQLHLTNVCRACKHGLTGLETSVNRLVAPGLPEPSIEPSLEPGTSPGEDSATEVATSSPAPKGAKKVKSVFTDQDRQDMIAKYQGQLKDPDFEINRALNHKASDRWKDKRQGVDDWLRSEADKPWKNGTPSRNGAPAAPAGAPRVEMIRPGVPVRYSPPMSPERKAAVDILHEQDREKERQRVAKLPS